jgi:hypothetical protein
MKKPLFLILSILLVLVLAVVAAVALAGGSLVRRAVNGDGPALLGVPVKLAEAKVSLLRRHVRLTGLHIGNPGGFKTDSLFEVGTIEIKLKPSSLLSDTIVIEKILVEAPQITFERGLRQSNLGALIEGMGKKGDGDKPGTPTPTEPTPTTAEKPGKKVVIDELTVSDGKVKLSVTAAMGFAAPIALSTISMKDIGRDSGTKGMGVADVVQFVLGTVLKSVLQAVGSAGELAVDGVKAVGGVAVDGVSAVGGAAAQGASAIGGAAAGQVRNLGGGVGRALGGILGGGAKTNAPASR